MEVVVGEDVGEVKVAKVAAKAAAKVIKHADRAAVNHELLKNAVKELAQHLVYVNVLDVRNLVVIVVNVLVTFVKKNLNLTQYPNLNQDPNLNQNLNQDQEQIKS